MCLYSHCYYYYDYCILLCYYLHVDALGVQLLHLGYIEACVLFVHIDFCSGCSSVEPIRNTPDATRMAKFT